MLEPPPTPYPCKKGSTINALLDPLARVRANTPGQSGDVDSPHYRDLFELWKNDRYFPVKYSRPAVEGVTELKIVMTPAR